MMRVGSQAPVGTVVVVWLGGGEQPHSEEPEDAVLELPREPMPPWRIVKEKRATFAQTPDQLRRRPGAATRWRNLALAGDWTDTGLPATIEGAIRSGAAAARCVRDTA